MKTRIGILLVWLLLLALPVSAYGPVTLQNAATATGVGTVQAVSDTFPYWTIQVTIAGTATVQCQGSLDNTTFETLGSLTASGSCVTEGAWKYIRANISACTACTVTAKAVLAQ
jgi:hypothetical protein